MNTNTHRRIQDNIGSKNTGHTMNLDRRVKINERRDLNSNFSYNGPARRFTIDRRLNVDDRRASEGKNN